MEKMNNQRHFKHRATSTLWSTDESGLLLINAKDGSTVPLSITEGSHDWIECDSKTEGKPPKFKPALYAYIYQELQAVVYKMGYNLVIHGSLNRDCDMILIPWAEKVGGELTTLKLMAETIGGDLMKHTNDPKNPYRSYLYQGRKSYVINLRRGETIKGVWVDHQYYLDISVTPRGKNPQPTKQG